MSLWHITVYLDLPLHLYGTLLCLGEWYVLFILVMEAFSKKIFGIVEGGFISRFPVGEANTSSVLVSHLLFSLMTP